MPDCEELMAQATRKTLLVFSQTFVPDPAAVGQHMADVAIAMARRGHRVIVYTADRGYEDPSVRYPAREVLEGVEIRRLALSSFGKRNLITRALGTFTFMMQCLFIGLFTRNLGGIFFSTSPPLVGAAASVVRLLRGVPIAYWAMDLNPDQLIAMGKIKARSLTARLLELVNRFILRRTSLVIALDRFMADRLRARGVADVKMEVLPPWSHEQYIGGASAADREAFRRRHGLAGKFVVMYSGNHSPANPLRTLLDAAVRLRADDRLRFVFVGGGHGKREVEAVAREHALANVVSLPYQPLEDLGASLGAADVHVVSLGENMVGIIHPCKIYGAMTVGRPVLFLGPATSHVGDLLAGHGIGRRVSQGDVYGCVAAVRELAEMPAGELARVGARAMAVLRESLGQAMLCGRVCDALERVYGRAPRPVAPVAPRTVVGPTPVENVIVPDERRVSCAR